jgi:regulator of RNase E activity RraA
MSENPAVRLARLDACAVSDALDSCGLPGAVTGIRALAAGRRLVGAAVTVKLAAGNAPAGTPPRHLGTTAVELAGPGQVIVIEQSTGIDCAAWGGILSNAARVRAVEGVIVEGPARDIDEAQEIGFTVFARSATARTARGRVHESATNAPVRVGEATVHAGDWVIADSSGICFVPQARADEVLRTAERIHSREALMNKAVRAGEPAGRVMGADYEHMLARPAQEA